MRQITWNDDYKLGIDMIDKDHKLLFSTINKLLRLSQDGDKHEWLCREAVKYLKNHSLEHFEREEQYMKSSGYAEFDIHKRLHDNFKDKTLPALEKELEETDFSTETVGHFLGVCIGWVISHTLTEDMAIGGKTNSKWADIPKEGLQEAIERTILQVSQEIFHVKAKMISEQYDGQDFGKVVCYRYIYRGQEDQKWEVILVYEEQLLLKIMSGILNINYYKIDAMAINVSRYITRQFIERVRESFLSLEFFELEQENLLTHEQLLDTFEHAQPSCSLLFNAGAGYFAFCATTADSLNEESEDSINHQNAMDIVNQYIEKENKEWEEQKKRILIVDDSDFLRKNIIRLLGEDYNMLEASSSVSAIQSIVINKPDLILLDYEMPVCDGRQTLEMIRSEESTADIPVIFLTGRQDRESVKKVMSLKPEGYLLKTMSEDNIKKFIDNFFDRQK